MTAATATERETHRAAVRAALARVGISCPALARLLGERESLVDAWMRPGASNCTPAWAVDKLRTLRGDFAAALAQELGDTGDTGGTSTDDESRALALVRAYGLALHVVATPARRTPEGARAALAALARVEGAQARVVPALRRAA